MHILIGEFEEAESPQLRGTCLLW